MNDGSALNTCRFAVISVTLSFSHLPQPQNAQAFFLPASLAAAFRRAATSPSANHRLAFTS